jgi:S1-C subfamily serine protease
MAKWLAILWIASSIIGWAQNRTRFVIGVTLFGPNESCKDGPVFIAGVTPKSPAASAGVELGDQLLAINGDAVRSFGDASNRIVSTVPEPVVLTVRRSQSVRTISIQREKSESVWSRIGLRLLDGGFLVGTDYTDAEIAEIRRLHAELDRAVSRRDFVNIFPGHYPADKNLYYAGFELFVWDDGQKVYVGAIEDGPAKERGVRWGDQIILVNGQDPRNSLKFA